MAGRGQRPARVFRGKIVHSDLGDLRRGTNAKVTFGHSAAHPQKANEPGTHTLVMGSQTLMSFTCHTVGTVGRHGTADVQEAD